MPFRLPASPHPTTGVDTSRRWLWLALLTGVLALLLAGLAGYFSLRPMVSPLAATWLKPD